MRVLLSACLLIALSGCTLFQARKVEQPIVVPEKPSVNIDPKLLKACDKPGLMPGAMSENEAFEFSTIEADKLVLCGTRHMLLVRIVKDAFNLNVPNQDAVNTAK